jgi:hypothetical protein
MRFIVALIKTWRFAANIRMNPISFGCFVFCALVQTAHTGPITTVLPFVAVVSLVGVTAQTISVERQQRVIAWWQRITSGEPEPPRKPLFVPITGGLSYLGGAALVGSLFHYYGEKAGFAGLVFLVVWNVIRIIRAPKRQQ